MQYLLTEEEYAALKAGGPQLRREIRELLVEEFGKIRFYEDSMIPNRRYVLFKDLREMIDRLKTKL